MEARHGGAPWRHSRSQIEFAARTFWDKLALLMAGGAAGWPNQIRRGGMAQRRGVEPPPL